MKVDWESLRPYIAFALGIALLAFLSYRHRKSSPERACEGS